MGYTIEIEHSGGTAIFDSNYSWDLRIAKQVNARNVVEYVDLFIDARGQVVGSTPDAVHTAMKAIYDLVAVRLQPVSLKIKLDGVEKHSYTPATSVAGPTILEFTTPEEDGNGGSKWAYTLSIFVRLPGNNFAGLHDLRTRLTVTKNVSEKVTVKVWEAMARASSISKALAGVMKFKPSGKVSEEITRSFDPEPSVTAIWVWRPTQLQYIENVYQIGGGKSYEVDRQAGVNVRPLLHLARRDAPVVRVDGLVRGPENENISKPPAHWQESATMKRQEALEVEGFPTYETQEDRDLGLRSLHYQEVYVFTGENLPAPNHGSHGVNQASAAAPPDGAIAR